MFKEKTIKLSEISAIAVATNYVVLTLVGDKQRAISFFDDINILYLLFKCWKCF